MVRRYYRDSDKFTCDVFNSHNVFLYRFTVNRLTGFISGAVMYNYFSDFDGLLPSYAYEFTRFLGLLSSPKFMIESFSEKTEEGSLFDCSKEF